MKKPITQIYECPNCYYRIPAAILSAFDGEYNCPGCGTETINYFTQVEEEEDAII